MRLTILGSGTCAPRKEKHESGYLLEADGKYYVFDSGAGTLYRILDAGVKLDQIDHMFYTHFHNDHINDLPAILWSNNFKSKPREKKLFLYGPKGFKKYYNLLVKKVMGFKRKKVGFNYDVDVSEVTNKEFNVDNLRIKTKELKHFGDIAYRMEHKGKILVYSGDTLYCKEIEEISKDADVLILECGVKDFPEKDSHLSPLKCRKIAKNANVKKLVLVHSYPELDGVDIVAECKKDFDGEVVKGEDLMEIEVK
ncbi:ribonuclease Z [Candidatus Woesearchaeota archaeon]|nr:ribonuclease Z [Candidatus Woesearchaeota archaeon]